MESERKEILYKKIELLKEILAFVKKGTWARTQQGLERVMCTLREGATATAEKYNTTVNCIYVGLSKASARVEQLIGTEVLDYIDRDDVEVARFLFYKNTKQLDTIMVKSVCEMLPTECSTDYLLKDCAEELKHLKVYTPRFINRVLEKCDKDKLAYICKLLTTQDKVYMKQQQELYRYFTK